MIKSITAFFK